MSDQDDNLFDEDDALDYILYNESEIIVEDNGEEEKLILERSGCLNVALLIAVPIYLILKFADHIIAS